MKKGLIEVPVVYKVEKFNGEEIEVGSRKEEKGNLNKNGNGGWPITSTRQP